jgi:hypothetical protein
MLDLNDGNERGEFESADVPPHARKPRTRSATGPRLSRAEASRRNGCKSNGPRTPAGKARSRYNALKHGMTAGAVLLPGEDLSQYEELRQGLHHDLAGRNQLEETLIDHIAGAVWRVRRAEHATVLALEHRLRHAPRAAAARENAMVLELGRLLVLYPAHSRLDSTPAAGSPLHPGRLVIKLQDTVAGCDWLLDRLKRLDDRLRLRHNWTSRDGCELVRLMGHYVAEMTSHYELAAVILASECVAASSKSRPDAGAMDRAIKLAQGTPYSSLEPDALNGEPPTDRARVHEHPDCGDRAARLLAKLVPLCGPNTERLRGFPFELFVPAGVDEATDLLNIAIRGQIERISQARAARAELAQADAADAAIRGSLAFGRKAQRERYYLMSRYRVLRQAINMFLKVRQAAANCTIAP